MEDDKKRMIDICALIGWIISSIIVLYCIHFEVNAPFIAELYIVATAAMLGLDELVKGYIKYKIEKKNKEEIDKKES